MFPHWLHHKFLCKRATVVRTDRGSRARKWSAKSANIVIITESQQTRRKDTRLARGKKGLRISIVFAPLDRGIDNKIEGKAAYCKSSFRSISSRVCGRKRYIPWIETLEGPSKTYQFLALRWKKYPYRFLFSSLRTRQNQPSLLPFALSRRILIH